MENNSKVALVDLDGTLADYDTSMRLQMEAVGMELPDNRDECTPIQNAVRKLIQGQPGFWRRLPKHPFGFNVLDIVKQVGFNTMILTQGPMGTPGAWTEKLEWCQKHVPDIPVTITRNKSLVYGRVLVDDWPEYFLPWLEVRPRGIVICPIQPWNKDIVHPRVTVYDGTNDGVVFEKLLRAYNRD